MTDTIDTRPYSIDGGFVNFDNEGLRGNAPWTASVLAFSRSILAGAAMQLSRQYVAPPTILYTNVSESFVAAKSKTDGLEHFSVFHVTSMRKKLVRNIVVMSGIVWQQ